MVKMVCFRTREMLSQQNTSHTCVRTCVSYSQSPWEARHFPSFPMMRWEVETEESSESFRPSSLVNTRSNNKKVCQTRWEIRTNASLSMPWHLHTHTHTYKHVHRYIIHHTQGKGKFYLYIFCYCNNKIFKG